MSYDLSSHARETTLHAARTMFPHDKLPAEAYDKVVSKLAADAAGDEAIAATIEEGVTALDEPRPFAELDPDARLEALQRHEGSAFFELLKATTVVELYDQPLVWKAFGYEGPSTHLGGYLHRGFDDLDWLPDPPIELDQTAGSNHR